MPRTKYIQVSHDEHIYECEISEENGFTTIKVFKTKFITLVNKSGFDYRARCKKGSPIIKLNIKTILFPNQMKELIKNELIYKFGKSIIKHLFK